MKLLLPTSLSVLLAAGVMSPAPTSAETARGRDRSHDVRYVERDTRPKVVKRADGDITSYRFTYTHRRFAAIVRFRDLRRDVPSRYLSVNLRYESDIQFEYLEAEVEVSPSNPQGRAELNGGRVPCRNVKHRIDYRDDTFRISFPARCLQSTRVLDASAVGAVSDAPGDEASYYFFDRAPRQGGLTPDLGHAESRTRDG